MRINLVITLYFVENQFRRNEIEQCLLKNIANKYISKITIFKEFTNIQIPQSEKILIIEINNRPDFKLMFDYCEEEMFNIISNNDIYFNKTIRYVKYLKIDMFFALSRIESDKSIFRKSHGDSQDVWCIKGKPLPKVLSNLDFYMGVPGCDNKLVAQFVLNSYIVLNPSLTIRAFHKHNSNYRLYKMDDRIYSIYGKVYPSSLIKSLFIYYIEKVLVRLYLRSSILYFPNYKF